jgi:hypothetical protein
MPCRDERAIDGDGRSAVAAHGVNGDAHGGCQLPLPVAEAGNRSTVTGNYSSTAFT